MKIFKFGGASVKDAEGVKNLLSVLHTVGSDHTLVVVSAMGKTTNALEKVVKTYFEHPKELKAVIYEVELFHETILDGLFPNRNHEIFANVKGLIEELKSYFERNKSPDYNFVYDQIIGFGELLSTVIISAYLNEKGLKNSWLDVRNLIKTDNYYRRANVNWTATQKLINEHVDTSVLNITQGFLGSDPNNFTTTLGRRVVIIPRLYLPIV